MSLLRDRLRKQEAEEHQPEAEVHNDATMTFFEDIMGQAVRKKADADMSLIESGALVPVGDGAIQMGGYKLTPVGLVADETATFDQWTQLGKLLNSLEGSLQWLIGDWSNQGENAYGSKYAEVLDQTEYSYQTVQDYAYVARSVEISIRNRDLSFAHHRLVAPDEPELQKAWMDYVAMQQQKLHGKYKLTFMKYDRGLLVGFKPYQIANALHACMVKECRVAELDEMKRQLAASTPKLTFEEKQLATDETYIRNERKHVDEMDDERRAEYAKRLERVARAYLATAQRLRSDE